MATSLVLTGASWVDVNTGYTQNALPDLLPDDYAVIYSGLENLFSCNKGQRARTFQPTFGSIWYRYLQEPVHQVTAKSMEVGMIQSIRQWEPRINLQLSGTSITPAPLLPGYKVRVAFTLKQGANVLHKMQFDLKV